MAGYLEDYGVTDAKREKKYRTIIVSVISVTLISAILYATFRDYKEEQRVKGFLQALQTQDFKTAYTFWGCSPDVPCRDYSFEKFLEDWGAKGVNAKYVAAPIKDSERCGTGYIAVLQSGKEELSVWVERSNGVVGYAPWSVCPERKLRLMKWLRMKFGQS